MNPNISIYTQRQFPAHFKDYESLIVTFVAEYYNWTQEEGNIVSDVDSLLQNIDVDTAKEEFLKLFFGEFLPGIPVDLVADKRQVVKFSREFFRNKGTQSSYKYLFRILFGEEIDLLYPKKQILRASDGKWIQTYSFFIDEVVSQDITGKKILVENTSNKFYVEVLRTEVTNSTTEIFIDQLQFGDITPGTKVSCAGVFTDAIVIPTSVSAEVIRGGKGFKIGQVYEISSPPGVGTFVKVVSIGPDSVLRKVEIVDNGVGYPDVLQVTIDSLFNITDKTFVRGFADSTQSLEEDFSLNIQNYAVEGYFLEDYLGANYNYSFNSGTTAPGATPPPNSTTSSTGAEFQAIIEIRNGGVAKNPGYFKDNSGFLSDDIYLQDSFLYQEFSYIIRNAIGIDVFERYVDKIVHPAGMQMFSDLLIYDEKNGSQITYEDLERVYQQTFSDFVVVEEDFHLEIVKNVSDSVTIVESVNVNSNKAISDTATSTDSGTLYINPYSLELTYFAEDYNAVDTRTF